MRNPHEGRLAEVYERAADGSKLKFIGYTPGPDDPDFPEDAMWDTSLQGWIVGGQAPAESSVPAPDPTDTSAGETLASDARSRS
jgi:hypothetical protein